ncbi:MAG TPA: hypothetical protein VF688_03495 [Allosphingosinicella sp.]
MSTLIATTFLLVTMQGAPDAAARDRAIATFEQQGRARETHFSCIYDSDPAATRRFVSATDPYFHLDARNAGATGFSQALPSSVVFGSCIAAVARSMPERASGTLSFELRDYRNWAARRVYLERFPRVATLDRMARAKRAKADYGSNTKAVAGLLATVDCAVRREPATADWLVRNGNPNELHLDSETLRNQNVMTAAFRRCSNKATPDNGSAELINNWTGFLADSLLRMTGEAQGAAK